MNEIMPDHGISFEVLYMAWSEPGRYWRFDPDDLKYPYRVFRGVSPRARGVELHLNPGLLRHIRRVSPDILVIGGYSAPTLLAARLLRPRSARTLLGLETNLHSSTRKSGPIHWIKRTVIRSYEGYVIPGSAAREYIEDADPNAHDKPFITLPNIVDGGAFERSRLSAANRRSLRFRYDVSDEMQLWLCVARLESLKGLRQFFPTLEGLEGVRVIVAGEGSQRTELEHLIEERGLPVQLAGQLGAEPLRELYHAADLFVLPSLQEPYSLAAIEAAASGLPLLLSARVGSARDLVIFGHNGWTYDPDSPESRDLVRNVSSMSRQDLRVMGERSRRRYEDAFDSHTAIENLARGLRALVD